MDSFGILFFQSSRKSVQNRLQKPLFECFSSDEGRRKRPVPGSVLVTMTRLPSREGNAVGEERRASSESPSPDTSRITGPHTLLLEVCPPERARSPTQRRDLKIQSTLRKQNLIKMSFSLTRSLNESLFKTKFRSLAGF